MNNEFHLIGREKEIAGIKKFISETNQKGKKFLLISGEAGTGKTTLVEEVLKETNINYYTGRSIEKISSAYGIFTSIIRSYIRRKNIDTIDIGPLTKFLGAILPEMSTNENEIDRETLTEAISAAIQKISENKSLVIFYDDLQWADDTTLEIIPLVSDKLKNTKVMFMGIYQSDEMRSGHKIIKMRNELKRKRFLSELYINPFNSNETAKFIEIFFENPPDKKLQDLLYQKTGGRPFYIEELCETLINSKLVFYNEGKTYLKHDSPIPIPESVADIVLYKLDKLSVYAKNLLEIAAVAGEEFDLNIFKLFDEQQECVDELLTSNILKETGAGRFAFRHNLTREALLTKIPWSKKRNINIRVAEYFKANNYPSELVAFHFLEANELDKARKSYLESAKQSCRVQAYSNAVNSAGKALKIWPENLEEDLRINTLLQIADCAQLSGKLKQSIDVLLDVVKLSISRNDFINTGKGNRSLATIYGVQGNWELSIKTRIDSASAFEKANLLEDSAAEYFAAASKSTGLIKLEDALSFTNKAIELSGKISSYEIQSKALALKGNILAMQGKFKEGKELAQEGLELALENKLTDAASEIYRRLASTMEYASDYSSAKQAYYKAYNFCVSTGSDVSAQICLSCMSYTFFQTGELKKSSEICDDVIKNKKSPEGTITVALVMKALIHAFRGEIKSAEKYLAKSSKDMLLSSNNIMPIFYYWCKAIIAEIINDKQQMISNYKEVLEYWNKIQDRHDIIIILIWAADIFSKENREKELTSCIEALSLISSETSNPEALSGLAFSLGEFSFLNEKYEEAYSQFEQALSHQNSLNVPLEKMFMEIRTAEVLIILKENERASKFLYGALSIAKNFAIRSYIFKIASLLEKLGYKTERRNNLKVYNPANSLRLTKRQNEILNLLSKGFTNKEIAEQIFLSTRTVDMHVSNILERLNCKTRTKAISKAKELKIIN